MTADDESQGSASVGTSSALMVGDSGIGAARRRPRHDRFDGHEHRRAHHRARATWRAGLFIKWLGTAYMLAMGCAARGRRPAG